jgi:triosephosphate isomerase
MSDLEGRPVIAGNWKMNMNVEETRDFFRNLSPPARLSGEDEGPTLLVFPPALSLAAAVEARPDEPEVGLGIQNIHWEDSGAYTGELSASMARLAGATHVLVGHSERRHLFGETNEEVRKKVGAALAVRLVPVICLGETLDEREAGKVDEVILEQLDAFLPVLESHHELPALVAYEPVWAIGTGKTATPEDASSAHEVLRKRLVRRLGTDRGGALPLLYGGSVKPDNARELLDAPDVDGVLVGGASLDPVSFMEIAAAAL